MAYAFNPFTGNFDVVRQGISVLNVKGSVTDVASLPEGASVGDVYLVEADAHFYVWDGVAWDDLGTLQGATGPAGADGADGADGVDGKTILNGSGAPSAGLGVDGDFYLDTTATAIYGPKTAGAWGAGTSLIGPAGADGADGVDGASAYQLAVAGGFVGTEAEWLASLVGPAGADGADGAPGADGADGAPGVGVPAGGTPGQALIKSSGTDYDASWSNLPATDLSYNAATRQLASSTGADATLPLFTSTQAGLTPQSGGGTTNFLRADGTWAAPAGGGGGTVINPGYQAFANGSLIAPPACRNGVGSSNAAVSQRAFFWQIYIPEVQTFTQILCRTQSGYAGTSDIILGIYDHNKAINRPNSKIYDSGTFQITASGAANYGPGAVSITLQPGFYWLAFLSVTAGTTPSFLAPTSANGGGGYPWYAELTTSGSAVFALLVNGLTSLPATAPTLAVNATAVGPVVLLGV